MYDYIKKTKTRQLYKMHPKGKKSRHLNLGLQRQGYLLHHTSSGDAGSGDVPTISTPPCVPGWRQNMRNAYKKAIERLYRNAWFAGLLDLSVFPDTSSDKGLILIQIDGLSSSQFQKALFNDRLPFLSRLISTGELVRYATYSGMPSTTPAFQAELFYGIKTAVPAFEFIDIKSQKHYIAFFPESANQLAKEFEIQMHTEPKNSSASSCLFGKGTRHRQNWKKKTSAQKEENTSGRTDRGGRKKGGLLSGGTAYSTIFSGGAKEARYCSETMDLDSLVQAVNPFKLLILLLLHMDKILRIIGFALVEFVIAVTDFFRGAFHGKKILKELKFVPSRVILCSILRELIRFRTKMDIVRNAPVICANLICYDEQSHRRGPNSQFAHWCLKGIDDVIQDIYTTAKSAGKRNYSMILYSDHGQEEVSSYDSHYGMSVKEAIRKVYEGDDPELSAEGKDAVDKQLNDLYKRARNFLIRRNNRKTPALGKEKNNFGKLRITTMGPVGHVYLPVKKTDEKLLDFAEQLVQKAKIPLAFCIYKNRVTGVNEKGVWNLKKDKKVLLSPNHPYAEEVAEDLEVLCRHPYAGDVVISGWDPDNAPISFNIESGAHGGPGREETRGFALVPSHLKTEKEVLRAMDIRKLAWQAREEENIEMPYGSKAPASKKNYTIKIWNHNIHSCKPLNGKCDPKRTAKVIARYAPDIVTLQEVDVHKKRSNHVNQAEFIASLLNMDYRFFPLVEEGKEKYGIAILSRFPISEITCGYLPGASATSREKKKKKHDLLFTAEKSPRLPRPEEEPLKEREQRGVMLAGIETPKGMIQVLNTHFGLHPKERKEQVKTLMEKGWVKKALEENGPVILCGDFNAGEGSPVYKTISRHLLDIQKYRANGRPPKSTFASWLPFRRIDHVFVSSHFRPVQVHIPKDYETRMVSDHLPVFAQVAFLDREKAD